MALRQVVVGVDASPTSQGALQWALDVAGRYGAEVEVVHAWSWQVASFDLVVPDVPARLADAARTTADEVLRQALEHRAAGAAAVPVRARTGEGDAGQVLVSAAAAADLLVLGRHGQSALTRRLVGPVLGSVAAHCLSASPVPVVIVPDGAQGEVPSRVVVGVDGSDSSIRALRWARAHADAVGSKVVAVLAWQLTTLPAPSSWTAGVVPALPEWQAHAERLLHATCETALGAEGAQEAEQTVLHEPAAVGLLGFVRPEDVLVLGERGRGGFARLLLGSISRQCAEHAPCPVVVVPPRDRAAEVDAA